MNAPVAPYVLLDAVRRARQQRAAETNLYEFVKQSWHVVEPGVPFVPSWHIEVICDHLEAVSQGDIQRLLVNIPPRHSKSTIVSVMWPMWEWVVDPTQKFLCASYAGTLSIRDNLKARRLVQSPWYQERWGHLFKLSGDQNAKQRFENDHTGYRIATSVGGTATGEGGSRLVLDDPHGAQDAQSDTMRESALEWFDMVWSTRLNDPKKDAMVVIMQRLHESDISGHALKQGGWEHVCIPAEWDGVPRKTKLGNYDPRSNVGSLICPDRFGPEELSRLKIALGEYGTSGQLQQQPSPAGGGILQTKKFQRWPHDKALPTFSYVIQSYDTAFTERTEGDPTACSVFGIFREGKKNCVMLLDSWAEHLSYPLLRQRVIDDWHSTYGGNKKDSQNKPRKPDLVLVEAKGSGQSILQDLQAANVGARGYNPGKADKISRAHQVAPLVELSIVYIPESKKEPGNHIGWARPFVDQCAKFPVAEHDDLVDTFTQAMIYLRDAGLLELDRADDDEVEDIDYHRKKERRDNPYAA